MDPDRHGRAGRSPVDRQRRPVDGYRMRDRRRFVRLVADVLADLPAPLDAATAGTDVDVEEVPDWQGVVEEHEGDEVPLVRVFAEGGRVTRVVVYRRPLETRALSRMDLIDLLRVALVSELAEALGVDPDDPET
ncbi:hypothetical protein BH20ACT8_BH20ACT8_16360 [soil metagenome]